MKKCTRTKKDSAGITDFNKYLVCKEISFAKGTVFAKTGGKYAVYHTMKIVRELDDGNLVLKNINVPEDLDEYYVTTQVPAEEKWVPFVREPITK